MLLKEEENEQKFADKVGYFDKQLALARDQGCQMFELKKRKIQQKKRKTARWKTGKNPENYIILRILMADNHF